MQLINSIYNYIIAVLDTGPAKSLLSLNLYSITVYASYNLQIWT